MKKNNNDELAFHCKSCTKRFSTSAFDTEDYPEREWYPHWHSAKCPVCKSIADQAAWQLNLWKSAAINGSYGAKSEEGRAKISAANKSRDKSSYARSRFNAITTGATAETAKFFPARPGGYAICDTCEFLGNGCGDEFDYCARRTELFVKFHLAQEQGNGRLLGKLMASNQAGVQALISDMILQIAATGVEIRTPKFGTTKDGIMLASYTDDNGVKHRIEEIQAHPLLKPLMDFLSKNSMTLDDMNLTAKSQEEDKRLNGYLDSKEQDRDSLLQFQQNQATQQAYLLKIIDRGRKHTEGNIIDVKPEEG